MKKSVSKNFFSSRRRHTRFDCEWSSDVCSSDLIVRRAPEHETAALAGARRTIVQVGGSPVSVWTWGHGPVVLLVHGWGGRGAQLARFVEPLVDRKSVV